MRDLSILIPARNEMFLSLIIEDLFGNIEADTEIIAVVDGEIAGPTILQYYQINDSQLKRIVDINPRKKGKRLQRQMDHFNSKIQDYLKL